MASPLSFDELMVRLRSGDQDAAAEVFHRFAAQIMALARARLQERLRSKIDPEDILQSVFRSFFTRQRDGRLDIENWEHLWAVLMVMTLRKCGRATEYYGAARRDIHREVGLEPIPGAQGHERLFAREPTPCEAAMLLETLQRLLSGLPRDDREIIVLHLQGYTIFVPCRAGGPDYSPDSRPGAETDSADGRRAGAVCLKINASEVFSHGSCFPDRHGDGSLVGRAGTARGRVRDSLAGRTKSPPRPLLAGR
jgi:RNA polymerase sigma-70 factor, ECF subfamily